MKLSRFHYSLGHIIHLKNMVLMFYMLIPHPFALTIKQYTPSQGKMVPHLYLNE